MNKTEKIGIIGGGISGLSAAWHLSKESNVVLFEKNDYLGGHAHTVKVRDNNNEIFIDTGFMVFNDENYPNLLKLFDNLEINSYSSNMSFSLSIDSLNYEYSGSGLIGYFGQIKNLLNYQHWKQLINIRKFYLSAEKNIVKYNKNTSLEEFLRSEKYPNYFIQNHVIPMCSAIWSCNPEKMLDYPAFDFVRFFANHGLFKISKRPLWKSIIGGSMRYVDGILNSSSFDTKLNTEITEIKKDGNKYEVYFGDGEKESFDKLIFATPANESCKIIKPLNPELAKILEKFEYQENMAILHNDASQMPKTKKLWSSWNYIKKDNIKDSDNLSITYWLNSIQKLRTDLNFFLTLNPHKKIREDCIHKVIKFSHPIFDTKNRALKDKILQKQGDNNIWICGSFLGYGFHEDGIQSGLLVAEDISKRNRPWTTDESWNRLAN
jgi:uncharacterized protein